jgi:uncharacterized protein YndB with AHSA1/START domain
MKNATQNSKIIKASAEKIYRAFSNAKAREAWQAPGDMTAKMQAFDFREGGGYTMSLFYPQTEKRMKGKTTEREDKFTSSFIELISNKKIVEAIKFHTADPGFTGEMIMEVSFEPVTSGTNVCFKFMNLPEGIKPEDNEQGTNSTLEKLAVFVAKYC